MDYLSLFPAYTRSLPRFTALAEALLRQAGDLADLVSATEAGFSFAFAEGVLLDALGESVAIPRQAGWDDETYRTVLLRKLKRFSWDGTNGTVSAFLREGENLKDNGDGTVTVRSEALPLPAKELLPVPMGVRAVPE